MKQSHPYPNLVDSRKKRRKNSDIRDLVPQSRDLLRGMYTSFDLADIAQAYAIENSIELLSFPSVQNINKKKLSDSSSQKILFYGMEFKHDQKNDFKKNLKEIKTLLYDIKALVKIACIIHYPDHFVLLLLNKDFDSEKEKTNSESEFFYITFINSKPTLYKKLDNAIKGIVGDIFPNIELKCNDNYVQPDDVSCGVICIAMALYFFTNNSINSNSLLTQLQEFCKADSVITLRRKHQILLNEFDQKNNKIQSDVTVSFNESFKEGNIKSSSDIINNDLKITELSVQPPSYISQVSANRYNNFDFGKYPFLVLENLDKERVENFSNAFAEHVRTECSKILHLPILIFFPFQERNDYYFKRISKIQRLLYRLKIQLDRLQIINQNDSLVIIRIAVVVYRNNSNNNSKLSVDDVLLTNSQFVNHILFAEYITNQSKTYLHVELMELTMDQWKPQPSGINVFTGKNDEEKIYQIFKNITSNYYFNSIVYLININDPVFFIKIFFDFAYVGLSPREEDEKNKKCRLFPIMNSDIQNYTRKQYKLATEHKFKFARIKGLIFLPPLTSTSAVPGKQTSYPETPNSPIINRHTLFPFSEPPLTSPQIATPPTFPSPSLSQSPTTSSTALLSPPPPFTPFYQKPLTQNELNELVHKFG